MAIGNARSAAGSALLQDDNTRSTSELHAWLCLGVNMLTLGLFSKEGHT